MKCDLLHVKASLASGVSCWRVKKAFDGIRWAVESGRAEVDRAINNPITTMAQDAYEFEGAIVDNSTDSRGTRKIARRHTAGKGLQDLQVVYLGERGGGMPYGERRSSRGVGGMMQERIEGLVLLRGPWVRPCGTGTTAACAQHEPTTFPLRK